MKLGVLNFGKLSGGSVWQRADVIATKKLIKEHLERQNHTNHQARLNFILRTLRDVEDDYNPVSQLKLYVLIMSALVHHERHGGLPLSQVRRFSRYAVAILQAQRIQPVRSRLSFLYAELHLVLSQIYRREGRHFSSFWEQHLSTHFSTGMHQHEDLQRMARAIRNLRLGNGSLAWQALQEIDSQSKHVPPSLFHLRQVHCLRLQNRLQEADELDDSRNIPEGDFDILLELTWESVVRQVMRTGDLQPMLQLVSRTGTHRLGIYPLEAFFWARVHPSTLWMERAPSRHKIKTKVKNAGPIDKHFLECALVMDEAYDVERPFVQRLMRVGEMLSELDELISIDKVLLVLLAATRWLHRNRLGELWRATFAEYQSLSWRLTEGTSGDVLSIAGDLLEKKDLKRDESA